MWLPPAATAVERDSQRSLSALWFPHDHDFSFLTVGYWGSGYATSIWEYDSQKVVGRITEPVDLTFLEHTTLPRGKVMFYRASSMFTRRISFRVVSVPEPIAIAGNGSMSQYMFDPGAGVISGIIPKLALNRVSLCLLARHIGNDETADRLESLTVAHPDPRLTVGSL